MKSSKYSEAKIIAILREAENGGKVTDLCRKYGMSDVTFYKWRSRYGGMDASDIKRLKALEEENRRLKQMYAELSLDHKVLKDIVEKKL
jgi:putative transposase